MAQYRQGQWNAALASLEKANGIFQEHDLGTWWFLAMAHGHLGEKEAARACYARADKLTRIFEYPRQEDVRWHTEAAELLGIAPEKPEPKSRPGWTALVSAKTSSAFSRGLSPPRGSGQLGWRWGIGSPVSPAD